MPNCGHCARPIIRVHRTAGADCRPACSEACAMAIEDDEARDELKEAKELANAAHADAEADYNRDRGV